MSALQVFANPEFGSVRGLTIDGESWAVGKDVAAALGYMDTADALKRHVDDEDKLTRCFTDSGQSREMYIINESGLYSLILSSKLPRAKKFKRWITSEVLPALRRTGHYEMEAAQIQNAPGGELTARDYIAAARTVAMCPKGQLSAVLTLLERSGLDMSGLELQTHVPLAPRGNLTPTLDAETVQRIIDFTRRRVPLDWQRWDLEARRAYWAGETPDVPTRDRDRISAMEVWCELFGGDRKNSGNMTRAINAVIQSIPGWQRCTVRVGSDYGVVHGFVQEARYLA